MPSKLEAHKEGVMKMLAEGYSHREIAEHYGVGKSTVTDYVHKAWPYGPTENLIAEPVDDDVSREEILDRENRELKSQIRKARTIDVQAERVLKIVEDAVKSVPPRFEPPVFTKDTTEGHTHVLLLSDLHAGEVVTPEAVNGLNEYNWDIMEQRLLKLYEAVLSHKAHYDGPVTELQIWMLGDMCSGQNHLELLATNEFSVAEQSYKLGILLSQLVEMLVPHYPQITIRGVVGNHPRVTVAPANKQVFNNFDWMTYKIIELRLKEYPTLKFDFPRAGALLADVAGQTWFVFHGDGIRSSMPGVPWGGVMRRVNEIKKQYAERKVYLDGFALGHFHQANAVQDILMNGSVKGTDEYVQKQFGAGESPRQLLASFSNKRQAITGVHYVDLA